MEEEEKEEKENIHHSLLNHNATVETICDFNKIRKEKSSSERTIRCVRIRDDLRGKKIPSFDRFAVCFLVEHLEELLDRSQGERMFAMLLVQVQTRSGFSFSFQVWRKIVEQLSHSQNFIQDVARGALSTAIDLYVIHMRHEILELRDSLDNLFQTENQKEIVSEKEKMESEKRKGFFTNILEKLNKHLVGPTIDQVLGCIIGQCVGDAVGFFVEGKPPEYCKLYAEETVLKKTPPSYKHHQFCYGQITDDSQLMRELVKSIVEAKGFSDEAYAKRIGAMFSGDSPNQFRIVGMGGTTLRAAKNILQGLPLHSTGISNSTSNGSAMRSGPLGLLYFSDRNLLKEVAIRQSRLTHSSSRCCCGAFVVSFGVSLAALHRNIDPLTFLTILKHETETIDFTFSKALDKLSTFLFKSTVEEAANLVREIGLSGGEREWARSISPGVIQTVLWALFAFLRSPDNLLGVIEICLNGGGDTDTTSAIACSLSGARLGLDAIPDAFSHPIQDKSEDTYETFVDLGKDAFSFIESQIQK